MMADETELFPKVEAAFCTSCQRALVVGMQAPLGMCMRCWSKGGLAAVEASAAARRQGLAFGKYEILATAGAAGWARCIGRGGWRMGCWWL